MQALNALHQFRYADPKPLGENLQQGHAYVLFPRLDFRDVSAIYSELMRHFDLGQSVLDS